MATPPNVTNTVRLHLNWSIGEPTGFGSRFFMAYSGSGANPADLVTLANEVMSAYGSHLKSFFTTSKTLENVLAVDLNGSTAQGVSTASPIVGTSGGSDLPASVCTVLKFLEVNHYRGGHPRIYLPSGDEGVSDGQLIWNPTYIANLITGWNAFITEISGYTAGALTTTNQVNIHIYDGVTKTTPPWRGPGYKYPPAYVTGPVTPKAVSSVIGDSKYGSQRRRLNA